MRRALNLRQRKLKAVRNDYRPELEPGQKN